MRRVTFLAIAAGGLAALAPVFWSKSVAQEQSVASAAVPAPASANAPKSARSRIERVTVYPTTALVTREVEVPPGDGLVELIVAPMPDQIVPSTMYSEAGDGLRVLTTRFSTRNVLEDTRTERRQLEAEIEKHQVTAAKIESEIASVQKNMDLLAKLEGVTERGKHTGDEVIAMVKYVAEQRGERAKEMFALSEQKRVNAVQMNYLQRKLGELGRGSGKLEREAILVVDREAGKGGTVRLNYLVGSVTWRPEYKVRARGEEMVTIDYLANLQQNSGEDWNQVDMTLSTAQPMLNASPPELCMLQPILVMRGTAGTPPMGAGAPASPFFNPVAEAEVRKKANEWRGQSAAINGLLQYGATPAPRPTAGRPGADSAAGVVESQRQADLLLNSAAAIEQNLELMRTRDEVKDSLKRTRPGVDPNNVDGPSVTYHLPSKLTVPSRRDEQVVEVVKLNLPPRFYYKTVPVLNSRVYRLADLCNKSEHILLPGEATMYQGNDFVGRMPMPLVAIGEEFTAGFGVDTQLQVQRQMIDQTRTTQGGNQVLKYDYRILVNSFKNEPVKLQVWDRLPKGESESVGVVLLKTAPELSGDGIYLRESRPNNLLRWDVEVPANRNGENAFAITYEFKMELDRQMAITGFESR